MIPAGTPVSIARVSSPTVKEGAVSVESALPNSRATDKAENARGSKGVPAAAPASTAGEGDILPTGWVSASDRRVTLPTGRVSARFVLHFRQRSQELHISRGGTRSVTGNKRYGT